MATHWWKVANRAASRLLLPVVFSCRLLAMVLFRRYPFFCLSTCISSYCLFFVKVMSYSRQLTAQFAAVSLFCWSLALKIHSHRENPFPGLTSRFLHPITRLSIQLRASCYCCAVVSRTNIFLCQNLPGYQPMEISPIRQRLPATSALVLYPTDHTGCTPCSSP